MVRLVRQMGMNNLYSGNKAGQSVIPQAAQCDLEQTQSVRSPVLHTPKKKKNPFLNKEIYIKNIKKKTFKEE